MPDYQEMYHKLFRASEQAVEVLLRAQRACEELYMNAPEAPIVELPHPENETK